MLSHQGSHQGQMGGDGAQRGCFIFAEEATVALDIGMKDHGQLVF
jgi:hypothetical protein